MSGQLALFDDADDAPGPGRDDPRSTLPTDHATITIVPAAVAPALHALAARLPATLRLGTSSWAFPGWRGLVWADAEREPRLARDGLAAYARHPLLRAVGIDRTYYAPLDAAAFARYASQVPDDFRFTVKAPSAVSDALLRAEGGRGTGANPHFLDAGIAIEHALQPALEGLGAKLGTLVLQCAPLPATLLGRPAVVLERLDRFFGALRAAAPTAPLSLEIRDAALVGTPLAAVLARHDVRYCFGVHARMPALAAQARAMAGLPPGDLVVRWNLHAGHAYEAAKARYAPFDRLVDPDPTTRRALARLIRAATDAGRSALVTINNKAEGSAPCSVVKLAEAIADADADADG